MKSDLKSETLKFKTAVSEVADILLVPHTSPDGDAIGSCAALGMMLGTLGKKPKIYLSKPISRKYDMFGDFFETVPETQHKFEMVIYVDCGEKSRADVKFPEPEISVSVDHHVSNTGYADINIIDDLSPATGEIIFGIFKELNIKLDNRSAQAIYMAIVCDTGGFIFDSTRKSTHLIAAELYSYDFPRFETIRQAYLTKTLTYNKLASLLIESLYTENDFAMGFIDNETYLSHEATSEDTDGLSNVIRNIEGINCAILLTEREKGVIKGSIRTSSEYDANALAGIFGGGGHIRAAGFCTELKYDEIKEKIHEWLSTDK